MFFVESNKNIAVVREDNVFCFCPDCGEKVYVDLSRFFKNEDNYLSDEIVCKECYEKYYK